MKKILILQNKILPYRKPVYNCLSQFYDVTVLHSGYKSVEKNDIYREIITDAKKFGPFIFQSKVIKVVCSGKYDVIIAMFDLHWINNILTCLRNNNSNILLWGHRYNRNYLINRLRDFIMKKSKGIILYSDTEINELVSHGLSIKHIFVAPNTVYVGNSYDCSREPKNSFLYVGRAQRRKKLDLFFKAFSEVIELIPTHIKINIVGSGLENEKLKKIASEINIEDRVLFHGAIYEEEKLKQFFESAYAYVSPGPVGLGALHSFAYGVPVVTGSNENHGQEFNDIIDGENSLIFNTYDDLKKILVNLVKDNKMSCALGGNAYKYYVDNRSFPQMMRGFRQAIDSVS